MRQSTAKITIKTKSRQQLVMEQQFYRSHPVALTPMPNVRLRSKLKEQEEDLVRQYVKESLVDEGIMSDVGHLTLDLAGFIPGVGEAFDITNVLWYAKDGEYLMAALSLISLIPGIGDLVGKGAKAAVWAGKAAAKAGGKVASAAAKKVANLVAKSANMVAGIFKKAGKLKDFPKDLLRKVESALKDFVDTNKGDEEAT